MEVVIQPNWQRIDELYRVVNMFGKDSCSVSVNAVNNAKKELFALLKIDEVHAQSNNV